MKDSILFAPVTYICLSCSYTQDTDPYGAWQQSKDMFPHVPLGLCPNCFGKGQSVSMVKTSDSDQGSQTKYTILSDEMIEIGAQDPNVDKSEAIDRRNQMLDMIEDMEGTEIEPE